MDTVSKYNIAGTGSRELVTDQVKWTKVYDRLVTLLDQSKRAHPQGVLVISGMAEGFDVAEVEGHHQVFDGGVVDLFEQARPAQRPVLLGPELTEPGAVEEFAPDGAVDPDEVLGRENMIGPAVLEEGQPCPGVGRRQADDDGGRTGGPSGGKPFPQDDDDRGVLGLGKAVLPPRSGGEDDVGFERLQEAEESLDPEAGVGHDENAAFAHRGSLYTPRRGVSQGARRASSPAMRRRGQKPPPPIVGKGDCRPARPKLDWGRKGRGTRAHAAPEEEDLFKLARRTNMTPQKDAIDDSAVLIREIESNLDKALQRRREEIERELEDKIRREREEYERRLRKVEEDFSRDRKSVV